MRDLLGEAMLLPTRMSDAPRTHVGKTANTITANTKISWFFIILVLKNYRPFAAKYHCLLKPLPRLDQKITGFVAGESLVMKKMLSHHSS